MELDTFSAISPIDGRYRGRVKELAPIMSEFGLNTARVEVMLEYLIALSEERTALRTFTETEYKILADLKKVSVANVGIMKQIETKGYNDIKATNHDVVAVVEYLRMVLRGTSLEDVVQWVHIFRTSEDVNNLAYALMLQRAVKVLADNIEEVLDTLDFFSRQYAATPMLARTHGQAAVPTTLGKEFQVFSTRLWRQLEQLASFELQVKWNGASGNHNAEVLVYPDINWVDFAHNFVARLHSTEGLGQYEFALSLNATTTQIEPHDTYAELFGIFMRINTILTDLCQDVWRYVSDDWLTQKMIEGEVGSSAMPQKVNPIDFENAEGNLGLANAMMEFFCRKLPISRLQRDLSDSTVERCFGPALAHCLVGYKSVLKGLRKVSPNVEKLAEILEAHPEVIAEGVQSILRAEGMQEG